MRPEETPAGWLQTRDELRRKWLLGDDEAIAFLVMLMQTVEAWDDIVDRDHAHDPAQVNEAFLCALYGLPANPFFQRHHMQILPLIMVAINAWHDANLLAKRSDEKLKNIAFHLRNMGIEFYILCAFLIGGYEHMRAVSPEIREFFAIESFKEWEHA